MSPHNAARASAMDLGPLLRERRTRLGFSTQQVAALAAAEQPGATLGLVVVHALGDALAFDPGALLRGEPLGDPRRLPGWFRSHELADDLAVSPKDARLFARAAELGEVGGFLWRALERDRPRFDDLRAPKPTTREAVSIYRRDALPVILLNTNISRVRHSLSRRAVIGHELCHLLHDSGERPHDEATDPELLDELLRHKAEFFGRR